LSWLGFRLLSVFAAALSILLALAALQFIRNFSEEAIFQQMNIDPHEIGFVALLALICPLMFSLAPIRAVASRSPACAGCRRSRGATALDAGAACWWSCKSRWR
jgi:hypothetical protein